MGNLMKQAYDMKKNMQKAQSDLKNRDRGRIWRWIS